MQEIQKLLSNPLIRHGLKVVAPELAIGIDLVSSFFSATAWEPSVEDMLAVIDKRLAVILEGIATTTSKRKRRRLEIRAHELLGILNEWEKIA